MAKQTELTLTAAQLEIMDLFWREGELGVAQVWKQLAEERDVARNTVQTMLSRLADKGWLSVRTQGNACYYRAARPRKSALRKMVIALLDSAFSGSASGLVMTVLENHKLSPEEAKRIRQLIDRAQREQQ